MTANLLQSQSVPIAESIPGETDMATNLTDAILTLVSMFTGGLF
jgi:hypothetical protein